MIKITLLLKLTVFLYLSFFFLHPQGGIMQWPASLMNSTQKVFFRPIEKDQQQVADNTLSAKELEQGWELLFDGKHPNSWWTSAAGSDFPTSGWIVEEGNLVLLPGSGGGDIISRERFGNFELVLDYQLTDSANTGIKYFVSELKNANGETNLNGLEFQLIDDFKHASVVGGISPKTSTGSLYLLYAPENKVQNKAGEWNQAKIIAKGNEVEHWLNGRKVLSYVRGSQEFRELVSQTKFKDTIGYGEVPTGFILLQDHHDKALFKNIKIRKID